MTLPGLSTVAVCGASPRGGPRLQSGQRVSQPQLTIVVGVNSNRHTQRLNHRSRDLFDLVRKRSSVRIAKYHQVGPAFGRRLNRFQCVGCFVLVPIKKMFGIKNNLSPAGLQISHRLADHPQVFFHRNAQDLFHMKAPALSDDSYDRSFRLNQQRDSSVFVRSKVRSTRTAEGTQSGRLPRPLLRLRKKLDVLWVGTRPSPFNVMNPESVEFFRDPNLVLHAERDAFCLRTVAQGCIVNADLFGIHKAGNLRYPRPSRFAKGFGVLKMRIQLGINQMRNLSNTVDWYVKIYRL